MSYDAILQVSKAEEIARANLLEAQNRARERIAAKTLLNKSSPMSKSSLALKQPKHWPRNEKGMRPTRPTRQLCPVRTATVSENGRRPTWMQRLPE